MAWNLSTGLEDRHCSISHTQFAQLSGSLGGSSIRILDDVYRPVRARRWRKHSSLGQAS